MTWPQGPSEATHIYQPLCAKLFQLLNTANGRQPRPLHKLREAELEAEHLERLTAAGLPISIETNNIASITIVIHDVLGRWCISWVSSPLEAPAQHVTEAIHRIQCNCTGQCTVFSTQWSTPQKSSGNRKSVSIAYRYQYRVSDI